MSNLTHQVCSVIPPHIIRHAAEHACDEVTRRRLAATADATRRLAASRDEAGVAAAVRQVSFSPRERIVYDARHRKQLPGQIVMTEETPLNPDPEAVEAFSGSGKTYDFFAQVLYRDSIDNRGMAIESTVHYGRGFDNAFWNGRQMVYGDGDRRLFNRFTAALDVIGHELTHGVTQYSSALGYTGESGALNEHISDVFGILIKQYAQERPVAQADWVIGRGLFTDAVHGQGLRSLAAPGTAYDDPVLGRDPQPRHMRDYVVTTEDDGGVHINSGIPNHAFYLVARHASTYAWDVAGRIWYTALLSGLGKRTTFARFAAATLAAATPSGIRIRRLVTDAWAAVGVELAPPAAAPAVCLTVPPPHTRPAFRDRLRWRRPAAGTEAR
jgi:Zn-dependent metalloprotease